MSATDVQLVRMSEQVYNPAGGAGVSPDWELVLDADNANLGNLNGYFGAAWYNRNTGEMVFAHRGTETDSWKDWMADAGTIFGRGNPQVLVAQAFREAALEAASDRRLAVTQITHTGHSLGGCISQVLAALRAGERAVTFNPLGSAPLLRAYGLDPDRMYANIRNVSSWFDPAALAAPILGQRLLMPISTYPLIPDEAELVASVVFGGIAFKFVGPVGMGALQAHFRISQHSIGNLRAVIEAAGGIVHTPIPASSDNWQGFQAALESNSALQSVAITPGYALQPSLTPEEIRFEIAARSDTSRSEIGTSASDFVAGAKGADALAGGEGPGLVYAGGGSDALDGGAGDDVLFGGNDSDILYGGAGTDWLVGGAGLDTYAYRSGDGNDHIVDEDRRGRIIIEDANGKAVFAGGYVLETAPGSGVWKSPDGNITLKRDPSWTLTTTDGAQLELGEALNDGEFGIRRKTSSVDVPTTRTIVGDYVLFDAEPDRPGLQTLSDDLGNALTIDAEEPDRADTLVDSAGPDLIMSRGGDDVIHARRGGDDTIQAGSGRDTVSAGDGNDVVEAGEGTDIVAGGSGKDRLYADTRVDISTAIAASGNEGTGERGDWLTGGADDDVVIGGAGNDALFGGEGEDLLVGGAGDDVLNGDDDYFAASFDWTVTLDPHPWFEGLWHRPLARRRRPASHAPDASRRSGRTRNALGIPSRRYCQFAAITGARAAS